jgi:hypothetical protein
VLLLGPVHPSKNQACSVADVYWPPLWVRDDIEFVEDGRCPQFLRILSLLKSREDLAWKTGMTALRALEEAQEVIEMHPRGDCLWRTEAASGTSRNDI